ncbi:MAG: hypothetical protein OXU27_18535 [Candidatus Poribacteria bacterium]|nr:hypothetical protein [Candidatus Poribacteria bacterium]
MSLPAQMNFQTSSIGWKRADTSSFSRRDRPFFHRALETLPAETYFPIQIDFQASNNLEPAEFYQGVYDDICEKIEAVFQRRGISSSAALMEFLDDTKITNHLSMRRFFGRFSNFLERHYSGQKVVLVIDEFDGIPRSVVSDFLYSLRHIYLSGRDRCPHSVGIVGVKSITQLNLHNQKKYIVGTKIWGGDMRYAAGKAQLAVYVRLEAAEAGYYVVFDHREEPEPRVETETLDGSTIRSYVIPVMQERPSS